MNNQDFAKLVLKNIKKAPAKKRPWNKLRNLTKGQGTNYA